MSLMLLSLIDQIYDYRRETLLPNYFTFHPGFDCTIPLYIDIQYPVQQRNLGSRLDDLHIEQNNVEQWQKRNSHYMSNCVESMENMEVCPTYFWGVFFMSV